MYVLTIELGGETGFVWGEQALMTSFSSVLLRMRIDYWVFSFSDLEKICIGSRKGLLSDLGPVSKRGPLVQRQRTTYSKWEKSDAQGKLTRIVMVGSQGIFSFFLRTLVSLSLSPCTNVMGTRSTFAPFLLFLFFRGSPTSFRQA